MELKTYNKILNSQYSSLASWAVWTPHGDKKTSNISDMSVFEPENIDELLKVLNPHYILVGLNVSREVDDRRDGYKGPWANFHSDSPHQKDYRLRAALQDTKVWGGYLTDIIKNYTEVNSDNVKRMLKENPSIEEDCIRMFKEEIELLGETDPTIIALGDKVFEILIDNLGGAYRIAKIPHYSYRANEDEYCKKVKEILERCK